MDIEATVTSPTDKELKLRAKWLLVWLQATGYLRRGDAGPTAPLNQHLLCSKPTLREACKKLSTKEN
jgi:hypothetical protein